MGKFLDRAELIAALDPLKTPEPGAGLGASVGKALVAIVKHLSGRAAAAHAEHERRILALEAQPFAYDGPHESGKAYRKGTFVTWNGSLWHANCTTASRPGDGPEWTLAVKRGKDAR